MQPTKKEAITSLDFSDVILATPEYQKLQEVRHLDGGCNLIRRNVVDVLRYRTKTSISLHFWCKQSSCWMCSWFLCHNCIREWMNVICTGYIHYIAVKKPWCCLSWMPSSEILVCANFMTQVRKNHGFGTQPWKRTMTWVTKVQSGLEMNQN